MWNDHHFIRGEIGEILYFICSKVLYVVSFSAMLARGSMTLQLFLVVWIFLRSLGVIYYDRWVLSEGHKNYFKDWFLMNSQSTFLFLTYLNLMSYDHIIKSMWTR